MALKFLKVAGVNCTDNRPASLGSGLRLMEQRRLLFLGAQGQRSTLELSQLVLRDRVSAYVQIYTKERRLLNLAILYPEVILHCPILNEALLLADSREYPCSCNHLSFDSTAPYLASEKLTYNDVLILSDSQKCHSNADHI